MNALINLINDGESKIVVLSAMSGTTNALVEISQALYNKQHEKAGLLIDSLEAFYYGVVVELYQTQTALQKGKELVLNHFEYIKSIFKN